MKRTAINALLGTAPFVALGCDATVALDPSQPALATVYVSGVCTTEVAEQLDISMVLLNDGATTLLPNTQMRDDDGRFKNVDELLTSSSFRFTLPQIASSDAPSVTTSAYAAKEDTPNATSPLSVDFNRVDFEYTGGENQELDPYLIVMMDQSASIIGQSSDTETLTLNTATDRNGQRIAFFQLLIRSLPDNYRVTVMGFKESFADDSQSNKTLPNASSNLPSRLGDKIDGQLYRDIVLQYLEDLRPANSLKVGTPLTKALDTAKRYAEQNVGKMRPMVVLFTDGLESGDTSSNVLSPAEIAASYEPLNVPVHVLHLQPPVTVDAARRGRDEGLASLACSTRGEYMFVQTADNFNNSSLYPTFINRLVGRWVLNVKTTLDDNALFPGGQGYLISTDVAVTLSKKTQIFSASRSLDGEAKDQRMWVYKP
jgi:hypothetical protein